ncbi:unnamed protein product [Prorocentrum cordatum]|uniref:Uncharacterized protein n=1 Tax=Prorocentrum cordatum TaxID=2364126 RepID=A0ABN9SYZ9_9DINO|nr:unnamed protein product [Polarella glacialis]
MATDVRFGPDVRHHIPDIDRQSFLARHSLIIAAADSMASVIQDLKWRKMSDAPLPFSLLLECELSVSPTCYAFRRQLPYTQAFKFGPLEAPGGLEKRQPLAVISRP